MKTISLIFFAAFSCFAINVQGQVTNETEMGKVCKVYSGSEGLRVVMGRIGDEANNEMLIGIEGIDHPWSGKIFKAKVTKFDSKMDITIEVDGKPWTLLTYRYDYILYLSKYGNENPERRLKYSETSSQDCKPEWLRADYLKQEAGSN